MKNYAKVVVKGTPITKSNFKMVNKDGRVFLPTNSGTSHDRYANYETTISLTARTQNPGIVLEESLIAILKVFYKSEKRHPDTINITKSIFDGIEKSGIILNDSQIRRIVIEEYYDKEDPRFELELFGESLFNLDFRVLKREDKKEPIVYNDRNSKVYSKTNNIKNETTSSVNIEKKLADRRQNAQKKSVSKSVCHVCGKKLTKSNYLSADKGKTLICKSCFYKMI